MERRRGLQPTRPARIHRAPIRGAYHGAVTDSAVDSNARLATEGRRITDEGVRRGLALRLFGGVGLYLNARDPSLFDALGRDPFRDLDFVGLSEERTAYKQLFDELGYEIDQDMLLAGEGRRFLFRRPGESPVEVDLFIDRLEMCHTLELRQRLRLNAQTVPLVDLLLQKLQIVDLTAKDAVDVLVLFADHDLGGQQTDAIDAAHAIALLSDDWGFYHTATTNLARIDEFVATAPLDDSVRSTVTDRLGAFAGALERSPKSRRWRMRAKVGTRKKWYRDVEEDIEAF
jgi:hypothetical protein